MLNCTGVSIELLTDLDMVTMYERGIRGGVSFIPNKYMNTEEDGTELKYLDANNLYGWSQVNNTLLLNIFGTFFFMLTQPREETKLDDWKNNCNSLLLFFAASKTPRRLVRVD